MVTHLKVYVHDAISAALFGRSKIRAMRKVSFIFFAANAGEVASVFTVFSCENMDTKIKYLCDFGAPSWDQKYERHHDRLVLEKMCE
jgi:hypothetical protein